MTAQTAPRPRFEVCRYVGPGAAGDAPALRLGGFSRLNFEERDVSYVEAKGTSDDATTL